MNDKIKEEAFYPDWLKNKAPGIWRCYICDVCNLIYWHPLTYCKKCPGKLRRFVGTSKDLAEHFKELGYKESGI